MDADRWDRKIYPITISSPETGYLNTLMAFKDHNLEDGLDKRLSRFNALVEQGHSYWLNTTGSEPIKMRFLLSGKYLTEKIEGVTIKIQYDNVGAYEIIANDKKMDYNDWDSVLQEQAKIT